MHFCKSVLKNGELLQRSCNLRMFDSGSVTRLPENIKKFEELKWPNVCNKKPTSSNVSEDDMPPY